MPDVKKSEVAYGQAPKKETMAPDNPGLKLMLKMGWGGGGLGSAEEGVKTAIQVDEQIIDRQGLGFRESQGIHQDFLGRVREVLEDFNRKGDRGRLVFSRGFTNEERKQIHNLAHRCGLKSKSSGKNHHRQLVITRRRGDVTEVVNSLIEAGGEDDMYKLIPPPWCVNGTPRPNLEDL